MLRPVISVLCLALLLVPAPMLAVESTWSVVDMQHAMIAENIPQFAQADGSFEILGGDNARSAFAPDAITIDTEKPLWLNLRNTIFHHADFAQIQTLLEDYHRTYFSSLASGSWRLFDRAHFTEDGIYEEANARTLYQMFACAGDGEAVGEGDFHYTYDLCRISGDLCKVVLTRHAEVVAPSDEEAPYLAFDGRVYEDAVREGYLLQKVEDEWKIANIIFDESENWDGDPDRIFNDSYTAVNSLNLFADAKEPEVWQSGFSFEKCQREMYSPYGNYMSYIEGSIESPVFLYEKLTYERDDPSATLEGWEQMQEGTAS